MLKKLILIGIIITCFCFCSNYKIVVDKFFSLDNGKYFIQFYVLDKNNKTVYIKCWVNNESFGERFVFGKTIYLNNKKVEIKCKKNDLLVKKIFYIEKDYENHLYNLTIINPDYVEYDKINRFDVYYPNKQCKIKIVINNHIYDMNETIYGYYTKTIKINSGDKIKFLVVCPNKNYTFDYDKYLYNSSPEIRIVSSDIPTNLKEGDYLLFKFYILDKFGHRKYDYKNIKYELNGNKTICYLNKNQLGFYLKCYLNTTGKYNLKVCYNNTCIQRTFNVTKRTNKTKYDFDLITPKTDIVYDVGRKELLFRIVAYGNPEKIYEKNTGIVFKNESNKIFIARLPIKVGENKFNIVAIYDNMTINKTYIIYASNKTPTIKIYVNDTYKLNKSDKIIFLVEVKYKNKTLETGKVIGYIKCSGNFVSQDNGKFDYEKEKYVLTFYVFSDGDCSITVEYHNKDYVTVKETKNFKIILDKNNRLDLQITNTFLILFLIVVTVIILVIILKSVF